MPNEEWKIEKFRVFPHRPDCPLHNFWLVVDGEGLILIGSSLPSDWFEDEKDGGRNGGRRSKEEEEDGHLVSMSKAGMGIVGWGT